MTVVALLTDMASLPLDDDLAPLVDALARVGVQGRPLVWDGDPSDAEAASEAASLVVVRSPWEYHLRPAPYLETIDRLAERVTVCNAPAVLRWNIDKRYLGDLAGAGVAVVPTAYLPHDGDHVDAALAGFGPARRGDVVVKPTVSAGSKNTARFAPDDLAAARQLVAQLHGLGKVAMVQPYLARVDDAGESALVYLDGRFSHALRKGPLLRRGAGLVTGTFAPEEMSRRDPRPDEFAVAERVVALVTERFGGPPLYARVDLLDDDAGRPVVLEVELNEPSLFHLHAPGSADRFAAAIVARLGATRARPRVRRSRSR